MLTAAVIAAMALPATAPAYTRYSQNFAVADGTQAGNDLPCPVGDVMSGGGFGATYADGIYLNTSRPGLLGDETAAAWTTWQDNYFGGSAVDAYTVLICDEDAESPFDYLTQVAGPVQVPDGKQKGGRILCGSGPAVGGGGSSSGFFGDETYLATSAPIDDGDANRKRDDGWRVVLNNDEGGAASNTVTPFVICDDIHPSSTYRTVTASAKVPDGKQRSTSAECPGDTELVGGGVESAAAYKHGLYITTSRWAGDSWEGSVDNYATPDGETRKISVTATCAR